MHTLLFEEREAYNRLDVCEACWTAQYSQGSTQRKGFVSHWVSTYSPPPPPSAEPIQRETAEGLLRKLLDLNQVRYIGPCFILAVMLERRRVLKARSQAVENGRRVLLYEHAQTGEVFTIVDPGLKLDQLGEVQQEVARLLEHGPSEQDSEQARLENGQVPSEPAASASGASGADASNLPDNTSLKVEEPAVDACASNQAYSPEVENEEDQNARNVNS
ncbi:MAG: hypothetical protein QHJ82_13035 [Verrucomicrobiota bacterium]|nr:hypothetical protein [Verrucomicrobiota bacterium]